MATTIYFVSPTGPSIVLQALKGIRGQSGHWWIQDGSAQAVGVLDVTDRGDPELVADTLEAAGVLVLEARE